MFWARLDMNKHSLSTSDCSSDLHLALLFIVYYNSNRSLQWQSFLSVLGCCYVTGQICCQRCLLLFLLELWEDSEWAVLRRSFPWKSAVGTVKCTVNATPFHVLLLMKQTKKRSNSWKKWREYSLKLWGARWMSTIFYWVQLACCLINVLVLGMLLLSCMLVFSRCYFQILHGMLNTI